MKPIIGAEYKTFFKEIKERIYKAQYDAFKAVNKELINLYWDIGKSIVAKQSNLGWGKSVGPKMSLSCSAAKMTSSGSSTSR